MYYLTIVSETNTNWSNLTLNLHAVPWNTAAVQRP